MAGDLLQTPLSIGPVTIRNRLYRAPVLEGAGDGDVAAWAREAGYDGVGLRRRYTCRGLGVA